ncbi:MAG: TetR/AcrR family transcriptional regulator [Deltaproteobacteria bacterium]|nr:TetR/AcrR family transcriptional regulator [Deltaproteobacteria bacterium]
MTKRVRLEDTDAPTYAQRRALLAEQTRQRVLDAVVMTLAKGVTELSIPAVAKAAGVSIPTVTRHFKTKRGLLEAAGQRLAKERPGGPMPTTLEAYGDRVRLEFQRTVEMPEHVRAALANAGLRKHLRRSGRFDERVSAAARLVSDVGVGLTAKEAEHCRDVLMLIGSSYFARGMTDLLGRSADQAADIASWAARRLLGASGTTRKKRRARRAT